MNKNLTIFAMMLLLGGCATVRDEDGNRYKTVKINGMQWMAENLRTTHYADGTPIAKAQSGSKSAEQPLYYDRFGQPDSVKKYELLYNWYAAVRPTISDSSEMLQGVCRWLASAFGERMGYAFHRQCCAKYARFIPTESSEIPAAIARWLQSSERIRGVGGRALLVELGPLDRRHGHRAIRKFPQLSLSVRLFRRCGKRLQRAVREGRNSTNPLSLVILDAEFPQLCELDIPDRLDDYGMMVVPEGIALLDKWLSDKEKTCYQILEYNEKDHYKSALRAVWRLGGRASGK